MSFYYKTILVNIDSTVSSDYDFQNICIYMVQLQSYCMYISRSDANEISTLENQFNTIATVKLY